MSDESRSNNGVDSDNNAGSFNNFNFALGSNFLSFMLKFISAIYYFGIALSSLIFIPYFIHIRYIPNMQTGLILDGFIFIALIGVIFGATLLITGFPGLYYLTFFEERIKKDQKELLDYDRGNGFNEVIIKKYRDKFLYINLIITGLYVFILLIILNYYTTYYKYIQINLIYILIVLMVIFYIIFIYLMIDIKIKIKNKDELNLKLECPSLNVARDKKDILIGSVRYFVSV